MIVFIPHENLDVRQDVLLLQLESAETDGAVDQLNSNWAELLYPRSSSIISEANLSSSWLVSLFSVAGRSLDFSGKLLLIPNSTFLNQFDCWSPCFPPVFFCHIPRLDCSASRHKHVRDCSVLLLVSLFSCCLISCCISFCWFWAAKYQRWIFAHRLAESIWILGWWGAFGSNGKLVRARIPHMSRAASS